MLVVKCEKCGMLITKNNKFYTITEMRVGNTAIFDPIDALKIHLCQKCISGIFEKDDKCQPENS